MVRHRYMISGGHMVRNGLRNDDHGGRGGGGWGDGDGCRCCDGFEEESEGC